MNYSVQVAQIIKAALEGDTDKVKQYAELIAEDIDAQAMKCAPVARSDYEREARIIRRAYGALPAGAPVALDDMAKACETERSQRPQAPGYLHL